MNIIILKSTFTILILLVLLGLIGFTLFNKGGKNADTWYKVSLVSLISAAVITSIGFLTMIWFTMRLFIKMPPQTTKETTKTFVIDSVDYHQPGRDNTLQVTPYWKCHLKETKEWIVLYSNKEVGDSILMITHEESSTNKK
jgi:hypothetical protein